MTGAAHVETRSLSDPGVVLEAAAVLRAGGVALLPTETVYGLFALDTPEASAKLHALKGERGDKPFARVVHGISAVLEQGAVLTPCARRLAARYWPGPVTLVLDAPEGSTLGFRVPGLEPIRRVLAAVGAPVVATSANRSGEPAPTTLADAVAGLGPGLDLAVDGGPALLGSPSTVVRLPQRGSPEILRAGFLDRSAVERVMGRLVVFVCTGNTCRSPMAEALFRRQLEERIGADALEASGWGVASAGIAAGAGGRAASNAEATMRERGLDISGHLSQPMTDELIERAWRVVCLTPGHWQAIASRWPEHEEKLLVLDPRGVPDPIGGDLEIYRACAAHIDARIVHLLEKELNVDDEQRDLSGMFPAEGEVPADRDLEPYAGGTRYLVGGTVRTWEGKTEPVEAVVCDRAGDGTLTRRPIGEFAQLSGEVALEALDAAVQAWDLGRGTWPRATVAQRVDAIRGFVEDMRGQRDIVVRLLMWEIGKSYPDACKEFDRTVEYIDQTLEALQELDRQGDTLHSTGGVMAQVRRAPLGVCLCMGPFNYPLNENYTTLLPALAMGNVAVVKLPKLGMLCNLPLLDALAKHFPPGVVNVIGGDGRELISPIIQSGKVDVLAFIGSCKVASIIEKQHPAPYRLTTILGMDAKNPAIVLPDADLDVALKHCLKGGLSYNGQRCTALKILFVHRSVADSFAERLAGMVEELPCGMPWDEGVKITPLPEPGKTEWLSELVADAVSKGAKVMNPSGGQTAGTFFFPAVVYPVSQDATLYSVEQFGPIVPVVPYDDVEEIQQYMADSDFGQQVSVFGQDAKTLGPLLDALANQVCRININRSASRGPDVYPFTGRKNSAEGTLSITEALRTFSIDSMVAMSDPEGKELADAILEGKTSTFLKR